MATFMPMNGIQNANSPIMINGRVAGNTGYTGSVEDSSGVPFKSVFESALSNVQVLDEVKSADSYNLAVGDMDDLAAMMINSERAQTAFQLLVEMRNRVLEGYNEIMRTNV